MKVAIMGCCGQLGKQLVSYIHTNPDITIVAGVEHKAHKEIDQDLGLVSHLGVELKILVSKNPQEAIQKADVVIDFCNAYSSIKHIALCAKLKVPVVVGTTGFSEAQLKEINEYSKDIPIVKASNMSLGVNMLIEIISILAQSLPDQGFDVEITEIHHKNKIDSPSGTAISLANAILKAQKKTYNNNVRVGRNGLIGPRIPGEIGISSVRGGDVIGEHKVMFLGEGETIEIKHTALNRKVFCVGAVRAVLWIKYRKPGLYSMRDVLNIS
ncbi:4-hydroxy-tetrahydrodipicolinate reductase [Candidatus Hepatincolaceae symbiont of Richtersius coronifer]